MYSNNADLRLIKKYIKVQEKDVEDNLFTSRHKLAYTSGNFINRKIKNMLNKIIANKRIKRFSCHSFRHMNITKNIKDKGIDFARVNAGHKSIVAT